MPESASVIRGGGAEAAKPAQRAPLFDVAVEFGAHILAAVKEQYGKPRRPRVR